MMLILVLFVLRQINANMRNQAELALVWNEVTTIHHTVQLLVLFNGLTGLANRRQFNELLAGNTPALQKFQLRYDVVTAISGLTEWLYSLRKLRCVARYSRSKTSIQKIARAPISGLLLKTRNPLPASPCVFFPLNNLSFTAFRILSNQLPHEHSPLPDKPIPALL